MNRTNALGALAETMARDARVLVAVFALSIFIIVIVSSAWMARVGLPRLVGIAVRVDARAGKSSFRRISPTTSRTETRRARPNAMIDPETD